MSGPEGKVKGKKIGRFQEQFSTTCVRTERAVLKKQLEPSDTQMSLPEITDGNRTYKCATSSLLTPPDLVSLLPGLALCFWRRISLSCFTLQIWLSMANGRHSRGPRAGEERQRLRYLSTGFLPDKLQLGSGLFYLSSSSSSLTLLLQPGLIIDFLDASLVSYLYLTTNPQTECSKGK